MRFKEALSDAIQCMSAARLRTGLTLLGIIAGVMGVIVLAGFSHGTSNAFYERLAPMSGALSIAKKSTPGQLGGGPVLPLTEGDAAALADPEAAKNYHSVTAYRTGSAVLRDGEKEWSMGIVGVSGSYLMAENRTMQSGRMFTEQEERDRAKVIAVSTDVVEYFFNKDDNAAINSYIRIGRIPMKIVGVFKESGDDVVMPLSTARPLMAGNDMLNTIKMIASSPEQWDQAEIDIKKVLDERHGIPKSKQRDYSISDMPTLVERVKHLMNVLAIAITVLAGICLLVGAVGIANMMLITVAHRTNEIGVRRAVGARRGAILKQFMLESTIIAGIGGLFGAIFGVAAVLISQRLLPRYLPDFPTPELSIPATIVAFGVSLLIGLLAGSYPALRACRLKPIDALRY